jgi:Fe-S cluster assembly scaffold protein SufB
LAKSSSTGHLDCQCLMTDKQAKVSLVPEVVCENKEAQVTHEASIGKISEEQLNYLRTRGLTEEKALNLIISGFLKI